MFGYTDTKHHTWTFIYVSRLSLSNPSLALWPFNAKFAGPNSTILLSSECTDAPRPRWTLPNHLANSEQSRYGLLVSVSSLANVLGRPILDSAIVLDIEDETILIWRRRQGVIDWVGRYSPSYPWNARNVEETLMNWNASWSITVFDLSQQTTFMPKLFLWENRCEHQAVRYY